MKMLRECEDELLLPSERCPRGGCLFCGQGPARALASRWVIFADIVNEMKNPALAEERRNREVAPWAGYWPTEYYEYLKSSRWRHIKQNILYREHGNPECERCFKLFRDRKSGEFFHLHHVTYARLGNEHPEDLMVLCDCCHAKEHGK